MENEDEKALLPHHVQESLCTSRLPYRQGRRLTAVKAYSITKESNHLLIFGVPSLNLRQETKAHFLKFGKLLQFNIFPDLPAEQFTETYHAQFEKIQCARLAKKMLDTKNFYGGTLHICYAPELESIQETKQKIFQRKFDVLSRLRNLEKELKSPNKDTIELVDNSSEALTKKLNMGEVNIIKTGKRKRKCSDQITILNEEIIVKESHKSQINDHSPVNKRISRKDKNKTIEISNDSSNIEIVDCTSVDKETITNIDEHLNYNKFGGEDVRKVTSKPLNRIQFHFNKS